MDKTHRFYEKHGGKTIILARFVPIVRTFAPFVAGMGHMGYRHFLSFNIIGSVAWVALFSYAGYLFGGLEVVQHNLKLLVVLIIILSLVPVIVEVVRNKRKAIKNGETK